MALINCDECGKDISDKAEQCVSCGNPIKKQLSKPVKANADGKLFAMEAIKDHKTNHVLHLLISVITVGAWSIIWLIISASNTIERNKIRKKLGLSAESNPAFALIWTVFILMLIGFLTTQLLG